MTAAVARRLLTALVLAIIIVSILLLLFGTGAAHTVYAQFTDAGQLVRGDLVTVAGHQVGSVGSITLTPDGLARVQLNVDDSVWPIREGTRAEIRQLSLTGVANRFVGLELADSGAPIAEGGTIAAQYTKGIVDLDIVLDALTPRVRSSLTEILRTGAYAFNGSTPALLNRALRDSNPALSQTAALGRDVVGDRFALERLVSSTAQVATALAARSSDLTGAVSSTAAALRQVATQRTALQDSLVRTPAVLRQARATLADTSYALSVLEPMLGHLAPLAPQVAALLRLTRPTIGGLVPLLHGIQALVSPAARALQLVTVIERRATPAIHALAVSVPPLTSILSAQRPYMPDLLAGFFTAVAGNSGGYYDANGHYARINSVFSGPSGSLGGLLNLVGGSKSPVLQLPGARTGMLATCPGGATPPAPDHSNPWTSPDTLPAAGAFCNPADDDLR
jgi:phospholipid/cholesterol/gamma-HCH transport system substrate-binding protein